MKRRRLDVALEIARRLACHVVAAQLSALAAGTPIKVGASGC